MYNHCLEGKSQSPPIQPNFTAVTFTFMSNIRFHKRFYKLPNFILLNRADI